MYENPIPIELATQRRIYSPLAYSTVLNALVVPIVHREVLRLATWYPTAWRITSRGPELVVVRGLVRDRRTKPSPRELVMLPLVLQAYPFLLDRTKGTEPSQLAVLYDDSIAEEPNDAGAPVMTPDGKVTRGSELRFRALKVFSRHLPATQAMSEMLSQLGLFEAWPLSFRVAGQQVGYSDLLVVRPALFDKGAFAPFLARFGADAAALLGSHRLSLFRAGPLLANARAVLGESVPRDPAIDAPIADQDHALRPVE